MTSPDNEVDFLHDLRLRSQAEGGVFWVDEDHLAVFEPDAARQLNGANWHRFAMPDRFVDVIRRRGSPEVPWSHVRAGWLTQMRKITTGPYHTRMLARMGELIDARVGQDVDLVTLVQDLSVHTMLPVALSGLTPREAAHVVEDLNQQLVRLIARLPRDSAWQKLRFAAVQARASFVIHRVLRDRARGRRAREVDLADPVVDMIPEMGMDRAVNAVTTVLTAIGGPPGAAAACVLYEMVRNPLWAKRLAEELGEVDPAAFSQAPTTAAPVTHRFVKEVLRLWGPPLMLFRRAMTSLDVGPTRLEKGCGYLVSPHMIHRDPRYWQQADTFDPDRFLPGAPHGPSARGRYVPFGWAPKTCIGASIGTVHLMALCYLMTTRYRVVVRDIDKVTMACRFAAIPQRFTGRIEHAS
jgi:cytochrome P450